MVNGVVGLGIGAFSVAVLVFLVVVTVEWRKMAARGGRARPRREVVPFGGLAVNPAARADVGSAERAAAS